MRTTFIIPIVAFWAITVICGCGSETGEIVIRERIRDCGSPAAKSVYLVNRSTCDIISFTIKITQDHEYGVESKVYRLNPGEEIHIGCSIDVIGPNAVHKTYEVVGQVKE